MMLRMNVMLLIYETTKVYSVLVLDKKVRQESTDGWKT